MLTTGHDGAERVVRAIRGPQDSCSRGRADAEREPEFIRRNGSRMRRRALHDRNLPTDNGEAEAANRSVATRRFKGSGMQWSMAGGHAIMSFRALILSGRFDRAREALAANDNAAPNRRILSARCLTCRLGEFTPGRKSVELRKDRPIR